MRKRTNNLHYPIFKVLSESCNYASDQAVALLSDSIFVILPFREVSLADFEVRRKFHLIHS